MQYFVCTTHQINQLLRPHLIWQRKDVGRVTIEPTGMLYVDAPHSQSNRSIKLLQIRVSSQTIRKLHISDQFLDGLPPSKALDGLFINEFDTIAICAQGVTGF